MSDLPKNGRSARYAAMAGIRQKPTLDDSEHAAKSSAVPVALQNNVFCLVNRVGSQICWGRSDGVADE
jgi:hypothetical protein